MKIDGEFKPRVGKANKAKTGRKVIIANNWINKKIVVLRLHIFLLTTTIDKRIIAKLKEDLIIKEIRS